MSNAFHVISTGSQSTPVKTFFLSTDCKTGISSTLLDRIKDGMDLVVDNKGSSDLVNILSVDPPGYTVTQEGSESSVDATIKSNIAALNVTSAGSNDYESGLLALSTFCASDSTIVVFVVNTMANFTAEDTNDVISAFQAKNQKLYLVSCDSSTWTNFGDGSWDDRFNTSCSSDFGLMCLGDFEGYYDTDDEEDTSAITNSTMFN